MQFEFPWALGPPDGRYVLRSAPGGPDASGAGAPTHVLVLATLGAAERRRLGRRRATRELTPAPPPTPVATGRATVIDAQPTTRSEADAWLGADDAAVAEAALEVLARLVRAHRVASADPSVHPPALAQALVARAGHGEGEQVADGRWTTARELDPARARRRTRRVTALRPHERLADLLADRSGTLACEELTLRARADLDAGALREAALQLRLAYEVALAELAREADARLPELGELAPQVAALADAALAGSLSSNASETLTHALGRLEAALRARAAGVA